MPAHALDAATLLGRLLLAAIFIHEAWSKLNGYAAAVAYTQAFGLPALLLPVAIAVELTCGVLILVGFQTRAAALILAGFCAATAVPFHANFSNRNEPPLREGLRNCRWFDRIVRARPRRMGLRCTAKARPPASVGRDVASRPGAHGRPAQGQDAHVSAWWSAAALDRAPMSGDPDRDFLAMMIPHHQGAVDMARLILVHGRDPLTRQLAEEIIASQTSEMASMGARRRALEGGARDATEFPVISGTRGP